MKKEGILKKITRRLKRVKPSPGMDEIIETVREAYKKPEIVPTKETTFKVSEYEFSGKTFIHVSFQRFTTQVVKKDPITRTYKQVEKGGKTTGFYTKDGMLIK